MISNKTVIKPEKVVKILQKISADSGYNLYFDNVDIDIKGKTIRFSGTQWEPPSARKFVKHSRTVREVNNY